MDTQWYYSIDMSEKQGPVSKQEIDGLIASGTLKESDLVWSEGMADWTRVSDYSSSAPSSETLQPAANLTPSAGFDASSASSAVLVPLPDGLTRWMNIVGIFTILSGIFSLCALFIGIFLILAGTALLGARTQLLGIQGVDPSLAPFMEKLRGFMKMSGLFYIVYAVFMILYFIIYFVAIFYFGVAGELI